MRIKGVSVLVIVLSLVFGIAASSPALAKTKVTVTSWYATNHALLTGLKQAFEAANPDYEIEYITYSSNVYYDQLQIMALSDVAPDVAMLGFDWIAALAANGMALDIDNRVRTQFPYTQMFPSIQRSLQWNGKFYALCRDITAKVFYYNKAHFAESGLLNPADSWTWKDFVATAKKVQRSSGDSVTRWGFLFGSFVLDNQYHWYSTNASDWFNADRTKVTMTDPRTIETMQFLQGLLYTDQVAPPQAILSTLKSPWENGQASMTVGGSTVPTTPGLDWGATMLPQNRQYGSRVWSNLWFIPAGAKNVEAAWKVLSFFGGPEGQRVAGKTGAVPGLRNIAVEMNLHPYVMRAFEVGIPYPAIANREIWNIFNAQMPKLWSNALPALAVAEEIQRQVEPLMK